jgi:hypothetical protein
MKCERFWRCFYAHGKLKGMLSSPEERRLQKFKNNKETHIEMKKGI